MKLLRIENYVGYIKNRAFDNWQRLPQSVKNWMELQDFVNEGLIFARFSVMPKFDPTRRVQFATLLYKSVDRYYKLRGIELTRGSRIPPGVVFRIGSGEGEIDVPISHFDLTYAIAGERCLVKVYRMASPLLRKQMVGWFFSKSGTWKVRKKSTTFFKAKKEFKRLAKKVDLTYDLCKAFLDRRRQEGYAVAIKKLG